MAPLWCRLQSGKCRAWKEAKADEESEQPLLEVEPERLPSCLTHLSFNWGPERLRSSLGRPSLNQEPERLPSSWARLSLNQDLESLPSPLGHLSLNQEPEGLPSSLDRLSMSMEPERLPSSLGRLSVNQEPERLPSSLGRLSVNLSRSELRTRREAKEQEAIIHERLRLAGVEIPPYEFQNFIGKGTYGRVYVAKDKSPEGHGRRVALKILEIDEVDAQTPLAARDFSVADFRKEVQTLRQLQSYGVKNVNQIYDVLEVHSQFWVISEYCPGGSVHTLMQGTKNKVEERYIVPIARELAIGLNAVHRANIIHRDVKAANVMIHEEGALQIIDFGVSAMLEEKEDKRTSVIGTPHWMSPEMHNPGEEGYGSEVDTWAFGCTLYEMATGEPPRKNTPAMRLGQQLGRLGAPKLRPELGYSQGLCDLVAFTLVKDPRERPTMEEILEHPYLKDTERMYPTKSLRHFVSEFHIWTEAGGQRHSLYTNVGALGAQRAEEIINKPEWRFSTAESLDVMEHLDPFIDQQLSDDFINEEQFHTSHLDQVADMSSTQAQEDAFNSYHASEPSSPFDTESDLTPSGSPTSHNDSMTTPTVTAPTSAADENKIGRGEEKLGRLFDERKSVYVYPGLNTTQSDLPLRNAGSESTVTDSKQKEVDANIIGTSNSGNIALADAATLKAKRKDRPPTMDWNFPGNLEADNQHESESHHEHATIRKDRKNRPPTMDWTFPSDETYDESTTQYDHSLNTSYKFAEAEGGFDRYTEQPQAHPLPGVNMNDQVSSASNDGDIGMPGEQSYEDPSVQARSAPLAGSYPTYRHHATGSSTSDVGSDEHSPLDLDAAFEGLSYGTETAEHKGNRASSRLDLDAMLNEPSFSSASTSSPSTIEPQAPDTAPAYQSSYNATYTGSSVAENTAAPAPAPPTIITKQQIAEAHRKVPKPQPPTAAIMDGTASPQQREREYRAMLANLQAQVEVQFMIVERERQLLAARAEERKGGKKGKEGGKGGE